MQDYSTAGQPEDSKKVRSLSRTKSIKDAQGRVKSITLDGAISEKLNEADDIDEEKEKKIEEDLKPLREKSDFMKVMSFNSPIAIMYLATFLVACAGSCHPIFGWIFSLYMTEMTVPTELLKLGLVMEGKNPELWKTNLETGVVQIVIYTLIITVVMFVGYVGKSFFYSVLGENVTLKVR